ncbi:sterigmatocystin 8-O-methyltransferase precursor [Polyplosphaeria fusca]|uniref:Sterigmatocystin 8-O-methyltransferase n=1 Tax=Polyplosphaeria fusca TaxID=682080 RepID=A0A9P4QSH5_9PLEO|nr:sterigmatocystin 8-O-methyltransferase precursor [Polyplosphaeria fusca]
MSPSRIVELAGIIQDHTTKVDSYLSTHDLPAPSFDVSYPARVPLPPEIQASQDAVLEASDELTALLLGPAGSLIGKDRFNSWTSTQVIERFGIARAFPPGETATFEDIAQACSLPVSDTRRILRHAMTSYIFKEPSPGVVAHTAASKTLAEIPPLAQCIGFLGNEMWPSASRVSDAMQKWPGSEEPNQAGFAIAYGTDLPMFDVVGRDPERAKRMAGAMSFMHSGPAYSMQHVVDNFDWGDAANGLLVDVGGGRGTIGAEIARLLPRISCVVQDLPDVIDGAEVPEDLRHGNRLRFMVHDFFQEQPVKGADVYYLRWVLHDWSDKYAVQILQNLVPALKKGARVLVSELCMPPPGMLSPYKERSARTFDLGMKGIQNAKERDPDDWSLLFRTADARFKLQEIQKPPQANLSIICAAWEGDDMF